MELGAAGLQEQPFRTHGKPLIFVEYDAQAAAFDFLGRVYSHPHGLGLFQGPGLSGKSTILRQFAETLPNDPAVAIVNGAGLNTTNLLNTALSQFGYELQFNSVNELINMLKVFVLHQTASDHAPLLVIENTHAMNPSALRVMCELAELKVKRQSALRLVLASDRSISSIVKAPAMDCISRRLIGEFDLGPLMLSETTDYLYSKLRAGGCFDPENVIPDDVCDEIHVASGGWPGIVDRLVLLALAKAEYCPIEKEHIEHPVVPAGTPRVVRDPAEQRGDAEDVPQKIGPPRLFLTYNGRTLREFSMDRPRILIGRSEHNDLCINSKFISRHHALFVRHGSDTFLMDLNSTNGTYVNSRRISNQMMVHDDVITIGNHGLKFIDPHARERTYVESDDFNDTVIMKNLQDMRRLLARENTQQLPVPPDAADGKSKP